MRTQGRSAMMGAVINFVPIQIVNDSIVVQGSVNGQPVTFVLDTGDAIGPTFSSADAQRLGLVPSGSFGVEGAGGASQVQACTASVTLGNDTWHSEPSAIDPDLGQSLIGFPFFARECSILSLDLVNGYLIMVPRGSAAAA